MAKMVCLQICDLSFLYGYSYACRRRVGNPAPTRTRAEGFQDNVGTSRPCCCPHGYPFSQSRGFVLHRQRSHPVEYEHRRLIPLPYRGWCCIHSTTFIVQSAIRRRKFRLGDSKQHPGFLRRFPQMCPSLPFDDEAPLSSIMDLAGPRL